MNEVKSSDVKIVMDAYERYYSYVGKTNIFNWQEFKSFLEPHFIKAGYRTPPRAENSTPKILIIHDSAAGDFITASGTIREIRRLYPTAQITLLVSPLASNFAEGCPYVKEIIVNPHPFHLRFIPSFIRNMEMAKTLLQNRFDICYCFTRLPGTPALMYMSGARTRITHLLMDSDLGALGDVPLRLSINLATHIVPPYKFGEHVVDANFALVDYFLQMPVANREIEVWLGLLDLKLVEDFMRDKPRPRYALAMGASDAKRRYPPEKFAQLVKMILQEEPSAFFVNLGEGKEDEKSAQILKEQLGENLFNSHIANLVGKNTYRQTAAILKFCDAYIGGYTGAMHAAAAVKCPVLAVHCFPKNLESAQVMDTKLFAPYRVPAVTVQPKNSLPECAVNEPYHYLGCRQDKSHCITQIEPATLFKGFKILKEKILRKINDTSFIS